MGNLLSYKASFDWVDANQDRGVAIQELNEALDSARAFGDSIFRSIDFFDSRIGDKDFFQFIYETQYDDSSRAATLPWLTQIQHNTLVNLLAFFQHTTSNNSNSLDELNLEFPHDNNGLVGLDNCHPPRNYVKCEATWKKWHTSYVSIEHKIRFDDYSYYEMFHSGEPSKPLNQIQQEISTGQANDFFESIHNPRIPHEKIHVHFRNGSALNIDGSWKHLKNEAHRRIPTDAQHRLLSWGFLLPTAPES